MVMTTMAQVTDALRSVFLVAADDAGDASGFVQRRSKFSAQAFVQSLVFGWLQRPEATLEELAQTAAALGVPLSAQAVDQRFGPRGAECLRRVLLDAVARVIAAEPAAVPLLQRFPGGVALLDSTTVTLPAALADVWPGCGGPRKYEDVGQAGVKLTVRLDLLNGQLSGPFPMAGRVSDQRSELQDAALPAGSLRLADLGFFSLDTLRTHGRRGVSWLTRLQTCTALFDAEGRSWTIASLLAAQTADRVDLPVTMGVHHRLPCRFLAVRVPPEVAALRRKRYVRHRRSKRRRGYAENPDRRAMLEWNVYVTNVPTTMLTLTEALVLARCRWQIELLFKLWKSEGRIDESRSRKPWRILCEVYAKLIGMVVQHWLLLVGCWTHPDRSLVKASRTVRSRAVELAAALPQPYLVHKTLTLIELCLRHGCRVNRRRRKPSTHQLLARFAEAG
jgi:hypothetical protein